MNTFPRIGRVCDVLCIVQNLSVINILASLFCLLGLFVVINSGTVLSLGACLFRE
jgi:hypothetical protein